MSVARPNNASNWAYAGSCPATLEIGAVTKAMLNPLKLKLSDQVGLLVSTIAGAGLGIVIGYVPGKWLGTLIWALISAVILGGAFYLNRPFR